MDALLYPALYQVNTRVWLTELSTKLGRAATLDDIPDAELARLAKLGFDWLWFLSVWQTGEAGKRVSRTHPEWRKEFQHTLVDLCEDDIPGSGFAIAGYTVPKSLGGEAALARLRQRMRKHGMRLLLDFVPNHMALDHPWVEEHADFFIKGTEQDLARGPKNYTWIKRRGGGDLLLAHGRDPYFDGWPDTLQLNYGNPATNLAMQGELQRIAGQCDGVRCDMAMLILPEVFERTWGIRPEPFWPKATKGVRDQFPDFCFMAEVYWEMEWTLQQQGFDYAYDKRLYDRLRDRHTRPVREHFCAGLDYQNKLARFMENHDEPRAAATFPSGVCEAAAVITYLSPGLRFFHQGQFEGRLKRISPHLGRASEEPVNAGLAKFYQKLLEVLQLPLFRKGAWQLLECASAWDGNGSSDAFIAYAWQQTATDARAVVTVNYSDHASQCRVRLPFSDLKGRPWRLRDLLGDAKYVRDGTEMQSSGLFLDLLPWQYHVFEMAAQ